MDKELERESEGGEWGVRVLSLGIDWGVSSTLLLTLQPLLQLRQRQRSMRHRILLRLIHLSIRLTLILKDRIPACVSKSATPHPSPHARRS